MYKYISRVIEKFVWNLGLVNVKAVMPDGVHSLVRRKYLHVLSDDYVDKSTITLQQLKIPISRIHGYDITISDFRAGLEISDSRTITIPRKMTCRASPARFDTRRIRICLQRGTRCVLKHIPLTR